MQNKSSGDGQHKMQAVMYCITRKYSLSRIQILYLSSSTATSWNVLLTCPGRVFSILHLLVRLWVWFTKNCKWLLYYLEQMGGESHPTWLQVSFSRCEMKGDAFLVICCASIYSPLLLHPHMSEGLVKQDVCVILHTPVAGKEPSVRTLTALACSDPQKLLRSLWEGRMHSAGPRRTKQVIF